MKLFTVSGAVRLAGLIAVLAGIRLNAQDVTVTDLALHIPKNLRPTRCLSLRTLSRCLIRPVWRRATSRATCWCGWRWIRRASARGCRGTRRIRRLSILD